MNIHRITYNPKQNSCSLYFIGCNFHCLWCYHKELYGKVNIKKLKFLNLKEVLKILKAVSPKRVYILSGDPCKNYEFSILPKVLYEEFGAEVRLLTNAYILPSLEGLKHVSISIKVMDEDLHKKYTGKSNKKVISNFKFLYEKGIELSASSVFIPGCIDKDQIIKIAQFIASIDKNIPYRIIGYMPVKSLAFRKPNFEEVKEVASLVKNYLNKVSFSRPEGEDYTGIIDLFTNKLRK
jgi:pyruvate formate lyase activating enzyme